MDILQRVRIRITDPNVSDELLNEYIQTIMDRLCLRLGAETLPAAFDSVCGNKNGPAYLLRRYLF